MSAALFPHLIRPWWLLALPVLPVLCWLWEARSRTESAWKRLVDAHLLPSLLQRAPRKRSGAMWLFGCAWVLAVLALSGPALRQPLAVYAPRAPLVVVEDMSSHMLVADQPPSRLLRARVKLQQLIQQRKGGQLGMVAYAGDAFTVAPISGDAHSLDDLVVALTPDTMPVDGHRADRGLRRAADLLAQAGFARGTILLLTDSVDDAALAAAKDLQAKGYVIDVLGVGTPHGAPLPTADGTFAQDRAGGIRLARLDASVLQSLALAGGGTYAPLAASSEDLAALDMLDPKQNAAQVQSLSGASGWRDEGPFLLLVLLPLAALAFRRGWLAAMLLAAFVMPVRPACAASPDMLGGLWQRADQRADTALRRGDVITAHALAQTPAQRAAADYKNGNYAAAAKAWSGMNGADADYNRGNALAQMQRLPEAIAAYRQALSKQPDMKDAKANLALVQRMQQQKKRQSSSSDPSPRNQKQQSQAQQRQGQSDSQENMQNTQQPPQQQGQQQPRPPSTKAQTSPKQTASPEQQDISPPPDPKKQRQADAAERKALQQALHDRQKAESSGERRKALPAPETTAQREQRQETETLLRRVPDEPGSLLRRKFALEYARRQQEGGQ